MARDEQEFETEEGSAKPSSPRIESIVHARVNNAAYQWWNGPGRRGRTGQTLTKAPGHRLFRSLLHFLFGCG